MLKMIPITTLTLSGIAYAFYPFNAEDTSTLGGFGKFQMETNYAYFKNYDGSSHQDYILQLTMGITPKVDLALVVPYSTFRYKDGEDLKGFNDASVFVKHIILDKRDLRLGYKITAVLDTGKKGIGYGKPVYNANIMLEKDIEKITFNFNAFYTKASQVEELRDTYGFYLHAYKTFKYITFGAEFKYSIPEERNTNKKDMHILMGAVLHPTESIDVSFGLHKSLNRYKSFSDYGLLAGLLVRF
ncbi:MAG: hypothetical protein ACK4KZ_05340 [Aquificaceae bacterium]